MPFIRLSRNAQLALLAAGALVGLHFYIQLVYKPLREELSDLNSRRAELESELPVYEGEAEEVSRLEKVYQERFQQMSKLEETVQGLEQKLPSRKQMASLLDQLTEEFDPRGTDFISVKPTIRKAEGKELFDLMEIETQFYADYDRAIEYLQKLEGAKLFLEVDKLEMKLDQEESAKPMVAIRFATFLGTQSAFAAEEDKAEEGKEEPKEVVKPPSASPFHPASKPFDNRLPGDHRLSMVIWKGGKPTALIDGQIMKPGQVLENKQLDEIQSDGVWFKEDGIKYFLPLEKS